MNVLLLVIVPQPRLCRLGGEPLALRPRKFDILFVPARAGGDVVCKHRLAQALQPWSGGRCNRCNACPPPWRRASPAQASLF